MEGKEKFRRLRDQVTTNAINPYKTYSIPPVADFTQVKVLNRRKIRENVRQHIQRERCQVWWPPTLPVVCSINFEVKYDRFAHV